MKRFLSIGEVSRIKNVSPKSLRYYEKLGILTPAYINPHTGYRYYSVDQLLLVELISICISLDIPLKKFREYITAQNSIDMQRLLLDGQDIIRERIRKLQTASQFLSHISSHVERTDSIKERTAPYEEVFPDRFLLTIDYPGDLSDYEEINAAYTRLFQQAGELEVADYCNQGILSVPEDGQMKKKIFLEIPSPPVAPANLFFLPGGRFICRILPFEQFAAAGSRSTFCLVQELFDLQISPSRRLVEIQEPAAHS